MSLPEPCVCCRVSDGYWQSFQASVFFTCPFLLILPSWHRSPKGPASSSWRKTQPPASVTSSMTVHPVGASAPWRTCPRPLWATCTTSYPTPPAWCSERGRESTSTGAMARISDNRTTLFQWTTFIHHKLPFNLTNHLFSVKIQESISLV